MAENREKFILALGLCLVITATFGLVKSRNHEPVQLASFSAQNREIQSIDEEALNRLQNNKTQKPIPAKFSGNPAFQLFHSLGF